MIRRTIGLAVLMLGLAATPALAGGHYFVRNETGRHLTCGVRHAHGRALHRFVLPAGGEWSAEGDDNGTWTLRCDTLLPTYHYFMRPGVRYELMADRTGWVVLRPLATAAQ